MAEVADCGVNEKELLIAALNGQKLTANQEEIDVLVKLRSEGRLLRWVRATLDRSFFKELIETLEQDWPEAVSFFYHWTRVEAWIAHTMSDLALRKGPDHLSLHYDGMMVDKSFSEANPDLI